MRSHLRDVKENKDMAIRFQELAKCLQGQQEYTARLEQQLDEALRRLHVLRNQVRNLESQNDSVRHDRPPVAKVVGKHANGVQEQFYIETVVLGPEGLEILVHL